MIRLGCFALGAVCGWAVVCYGIATYSEGAALIAAGLPVSVACGGLAVVAFGSGA
jgi:hypothetical protein